MARTANERASHLASRPGRRAVPVSSAVRPSDSAAAAQIISAAMVTMAENGYHGTSVRDIAEAANVSSAAIYHYFGSKHGLLAVIMERGNHDLYAATRWALEAAGEDPADQLRAVVGVHVSGHLRAQREAFIGNSELRSLERESRERIVSLRDRQQRLFDQVVEGGVGQGHFQTPHPRDASRAVVTMCSAVAGWYNPRGALPAEEITARYQDMALALVAWRGPGARPRRGPARA